MNLDGKVALVTGGASGLGDATTRLLLERGSKVVILDRNVDLGEKRVKEFGKAVAFAEADVTDEDQVQAAIDLAVDRFGALQLCVGCAGIGTAARTVGRKGAYPLDKFKLSINVNLIGMFNVVRLAALQMSKNDPDVEGERGSIIMTASIAAYDGQIGQAAYTASKAGVVGMTLPIARDLGKQGIRCNTICPGTFETPLMSQMPEEGIKMLSDNTPFPKRLGKPPEFASLAVHILENAMLNGETIRIDGAHRMKF